MTREEIQESAATYGIGAGVLVPWAWSTMAGEWHTTALCVILGIVVGLVVSWVEFLLGMMILEEES